MKYRRYLVGGFARYTSGCGRITICEARWSVYVGKRVFGRWVGYSTQRGWNVFVDGRLVSRRLSLLRVAKSVGECVLAKRLEGESR